MILQDNQGSNTKGKSPHNLIYIPFTFPPLLPIKARSTFAPTKNIPTSQNTVKHPHETSHHSVLHILF